MIIRSRPKSAVLLQYTCGSSELDTHKLSMTGPLNTLRVNIVGRTNNTFTMAHLTDSLRSDGCTVNYSKDLPTSRPGRPSGQLS